MSLVEEKISGKDVFDGKILHVQKDTVLLPNGKTATREVIRHVGAVGIVPVTDDGCVVVERQFRYPMNQIITEIPAGKLDSKEENCLEAAKRELREETGYTADNWINLGLYFPAAAYSDEVLTIFLATRLHKGERRLDEDEFLEVEEIPIETLIQKVMDGEIPDGKTQVGILKASVFLAGNL